MAWVTLASATLAGVIPTARMRLVSKSCSTWRLYPSTRTLRLLRPCRICPSSTLIRRSFATPLTRLAFPCSLTWTSCSWICSAIFTPCCATAFSSGLPGFQPRLAPWTTPARPVPGLRLSAVVGPSHDPMRPSDSGHTPVAPTVREVLASFDPREVHAYAVRLDLPEHLTVWADQHALRWVLRNVVGNAFKYAPKQTPISISAALSRHLSGSAAAAAHVCIRVQDRGPGISPAELPLLFQQFGRLPRDLAGKVRGSGLGLYISRQLVEAMHGQIWVESSGKPGEGSCFCFTLPSAAQPASEERPRPNTDGLPTQDEP